MSGVAFDESGHAFWQDDVGNFFQIESDGDGDYIVRDQDGSAYVLDDTVVDAALESYTDPADYVSRREFFEGVTDLFEPQPDPADQEAEIKTQAHAEEAVQWAGELEDDMRLLQHRLGRGLTATERRTIDNAVKNGHVDAFDSYLTKYPEDRTRSSDDRRALAAEVAAESMAAAQEQDAEEADLEESHGT